MGDRIAQLILEEIKTPKIKETNELEGTRRGTGSYGSTNVSTTERNEDAVVGTHSIKDQMNGRPEKNDDSEKNEQTPLSQSRQIITARQMQKSAKGDNPVYLAIVRKTNDAPKVKKGNKRSSAHAAQFVAAHGMIEANKRSINKGVGPKKDIITVANGNNKFSKVYL